MPKKSSSRTWKKKVIKKIDRVFDRSDQLAKNILTNINLLIFLALSLFLIVWVVSAPPQRYGDSNEYYQTMISLGSHASPDLRKSDIEKYNQLRADAARSSTTFNYDLAANANIGDGYTKSLSDKLYSVHFWLYPLSAVPVMWCLQLIGLNALMAPQITNALLVIFALALILFYSGLGKNQKRLFSAFILFSPAMWFLKWPTPEIFSFSFIVASIALFTRKSYSLAILCAALAAAQNPPIIFLVFYYLIYSFAEVFQAGSYKKTPLLIAASLPAIAPILFNYFHFETFNLIYSVSQTSFSVISFSRTLSIFFDLNQGILPYIPVVVAFFVFLLFRNWRKKERLIYELLLLIVLMVLLAQTTTNLNSDTVGIIRYAVWILPLFIWGVIAGSDLSLRTDQAFLAVALIVQMIIVLLIPSFGIAQRKSLMEPASYVNNNALASYILDNYPYLYNPEPEIFTERTLHVEALYQEQLPVIYSRSDGHITKILTDYQSLDKLSSNMSLDPGFLQEQKDRHQGDDGIFYINLSP